MRIAQTLPRPATCATVGDSGSKLISKNYYPRTISEMNKERSVIRRSVRCCSLCECCYLGCRRYMKSFVTFTLISFIILFSVNNAFVSSTNIGFFWYYIGTFNTMKDTLLIQKVESSINELIELGETSVGENADHFSMEYDLVDSNDFNDSLHYLHFMVKNQLPTNGRLKCIFLLLILNQGLDYACAFYDYGDNCVGSFKDNPNFGKEYSYGWFWTNGSDWKFYEATNETARYTIYAGFETYPINPIELLDIPNVYDSFEENPILSHALELGRISKDEVFWMDESWGGIASFIIGKGVYSYYNSSKNIGVALTFLPSRTISNFLQETQWAHQTTGIAYEIVLVSHSGILMGATNIAYEDLTYFSEETQKNEMYLAQDSPDPLVSGAAAFVIDRTNRYQNLESFYGYKSRYTVIGGSGYYVYLSSVESSSGDENGIGFYVIVLVPSSVILDKLIPSFVIPPSVTILSFVVLTLFMICLSCCVFKNSRDIRTRLRLIREMNLDSAERKKRKNWFFCSFCCCFRVPEFTEFMIVQDALSFTIEVLQEYKSFIPTIVLDEAQHDDDDVVVEEEEERTNLNLGSSLGTLDSSEGSSVSSCESVFHPVYGKRLAISVQSGKRFLVLFSSRILEKCFGHRRPFLNPSSQQQDQRENGIVKMGEIYDSVHQLARINKGRVYESTSARILVLFRAPTQAANFSLLLGEFMDEKYVDSREEYIILVGGGVFHFGNVGSSTIKKTVIFGEYVQKFQRIVRFIERLGRLGHSTAVGGRRVFLIGDFVRALRSKFVYAPFDCYFRSDVYELTALSDEDEDEDLFTPIFKLLRRCKLGSDEEWMYACKSLAMEKIVQYQADALLELLSGEEYREIEKRYLLCDDLGNVGVDDQDQEKLVYFKDVFAVIKGLMMERDWKSFPDRQVAVELERELLLNKSLVAALYQRKKMTEREQEMEL